MAKSNLKKSIITSFLWRHRYYVTEKRHQNSVTTFSILTPSLPSSKFLAITPVQWYSILSAVLRFEMYVIYRRLSSRYSACLHI